MAKKHKIIIIGAGFGGITLAKSLRNNNIEILLIDQNNYHNFQPLMYQIATGGLEPYSIAYPVRRIFRNRDNIRFRMTKVKSVDTDRKKIKTSVGSFKYDYLILSFCLN